MSVSRYGKALLRRVVREVREVAVGMSYLVAPDPIDSEDLLSRILKGPEGDVEALQSDWRKIGGDMYWALGEFGSRHKS